MKRMMSMEEFAGSVCSCVKEKLPPELTGADVRAAFLDIGEGDAPMILLVMRPWNNVVTGFYLENWYQAYSAGDATVRSTVATVLNDRRLYCMPIG